MLGVIPAAGAGSRIQPLAFSKELLPVGSRLDGDLERPRAVSEYLIERMVAAGADRICFVIGPGKSDIVAYYGSAVSGIPIFYAVQAKPEGLCDAIFQAAPMTSRDETVLVGLPDTVWFPIDGLARLPEQSLALLLFPTDRPELFDAVRTDDAGRVLDIQVKVPGAASSWIWGAFKLPASVLLDLRRLWETRNQRDIYFGTLVNAYLASGGHVIGVRAGEAYVDVGTLHGYREALRLLARHDGMPRAHVAGEGAR